MELVIAQLERDRDRLRRRIVDSSKWIIDDMQIIIERLSRPEPGMLNSLGEFQGKASQFDILCAEYEMVKHTLEMIQAGMAEQGRTGAE